jgi:hypothetical protein
MKSLKKYGKKMSIYMYHHSVCLERRSKIMKIVSQYGRSSTLQCLVRKSIGIFSQ